MEGPQPVDNIKRQSSWSTNELVTWDLLESIHFPLCSLAQHLKSNQEWSWVMQPLSNSYWKCSFTKYNGNCEVFGFQTLSFHTRSFQNKTQFVRVLYGQILRNPPDDSTLFSSTQELNQWIRLFWSKNICYPNTFLRFLTTFIYKDVPLLLLFDFLTFELLPM